MLNRQLVIIWLQVIHVVAEMRHGEDSSKFTNLYSSSRTGGTMWWTASPESAIMKAVPPNEQVLEILRVRLYSQIGGSPGWDGSTCVVRIYGKQTSENEHESFATIDS